jgi:N-acetyl-gamma-glutamyl-phosphate reductase
VAVVGATVLFAPRLLPVARGLLTACYLELADGDPRPLRREAYDTEPFVRLLGEGGVLEPRDVRRTNMTEIGWRRDEATGRVVVMSAIDDLGKGAAGQAVRNLNCMLGMDEGAGIGSLVPALP